MSNKIDTLLTLYIDALKDSLNNQTKDKLVESLAEILVSRIDLNSKSDLKHMVDVVRKHKGAGKVPDEQLQFMVSEDKRKSLEDVRTVINTIKLFCGSFGWDGDKAEEISPNACNLAMNIAEAIHPILDYEDDAPMVMALSDGAILLHWMTERGSLSLGCRDGELEWDFNGQDMETGGAIQVMNNELDSEDLKHICDLIQIINIPKLVH